jgi:hypothetical protein
MGANSVEGGCIGYVMAPTVNDKDGGPNELDTENGRDWTPLLLPMPRPALLLLDGVEIEAGPEIRPSGVTDVVLPPETTTPPPLVVGGVGVGGILST